MAAEAPGSQPRCPASGGCCSWEQLGGYSTPSVLQRTVLLQALGSHSLQTWPQRLASALYAPAGPSIRSQLPTQPMTVRSCTGALAHLSPVPAGCPSPSSRAVCHVPVMGTVTASQWSMVASRQPLTSPPVSLTSLSSQRLTLKLVGERWELGVLGRCKNERCCVDVPHLPPPCPHPSECS